jgi:hypothetical protein
VKLAGRLVLLLVLVIVLDSGRVEHDYEREQDYEGDRKAYRSGREALPCALVFS